MIPSEQAALRTELRRTHQALHAPGAESHDHDLVSALKRIGRDFRALKSPKAYLDHRRKVIQRRAIEHGLDLSRQLRLQWLFPELSGAYVERVDERLPNDRVLTRLARDGYEQFQRYNPGRVRAQQRIERLRERAEQKELTPFDRHRAVHYLLILIRT